MSEDWIANKINGGEITEYKLEDFEEFSTITIGAFSKVYKARLRSTKNMYALKIIENNEHINKELVNELKHMISMKPHKNIIEFHGIIKHKATLALRIRNGLREKLIADTPHKYVTIYEQCWQGTQDNRPSIQEVAMELKNIIAQNTEINIEDIDNTKTLEIYLDNAFGINNVKIDLKHDMILFVNNLYSTFSKLFNEGGSVSYIIINFISKHNKTPEEVFNWLLINNDNSKYILLLGLFYNWGIGTDKSDTESFDLFLNAATKGNVIAQYFVGRCYEVGWNTKKSIKEAIEWYNKAIGDGCPAAECMLGNYYYKNGEYIRAFKLLESAVKKGNVAAMHTLGLCYQKGRGTNANIAEGFKLFEEAAKMGLPSSQYELGQCYEYGKGTKENLEKALDWYQKAAEKDRTYRNDRERVKLRIIKDRG
ncbi:8985_t:CDS:2 [Racocetra persica]|uniref:8985_t:CDS:1 n=1 Tax=Racocetra persica TaxID=160502 RepID=A0ACA9MA46_9GLOM|nr:8985_t:CDS:2 [Racocetra persica]